MIVYVHWAWEKKENCLSARFSYLHGSTSPNWVLKTCRLLATLDNETVLFEDLSKEMSWIRLKSPLGLNNYFQYQEQMKRILTQKCHHPNLDHYTSQYHQRIL